MCEVCTRKLGKFTDAIRPFLASGVQPEFAHKKHGGCGVDYLYLKKPDGTFIKIIADGDDGGYFHWDNKTEAAA